MSHSELDEAEVPPLLRQPRSMRRPHQATGLVLLAFGAFVCWQALGLRYYTSLGPGPGFFSFWLGAILCALALAMLAAARWGREEATPPGFFADAKGYMAMAGIVASLLVAVFLLRPVGFPLTIGAILVFMLRVVGRTGWPTAIAGALMGGVGVYLVFVHWLKVPLPAGITAFLG